MEALAALCHSVTVYPITRISMSNIAEKKRRLERIKAEAEALERELECEEQRTDGLVAERFTTTAGRTGVVLTIPKDAPDVPILEYLIRAFIARGGRVWDAEERIKVWREARFDLVTPLEDFGEDNAEDLYNVLEEQPSAEDYAGCTLIWVVPTDQDVETHAGRSFMRLLKEKVNVLDPVAFLALALSSPDITDPATYPSWKYWELLGGLVDQHDSVSALGGDSNSGGLNLSWTTPGNSNSYYRARSVVRSTPG